jgi:hypothetical protein
MLPSTYNTDLQTTGNVEVGGPAWTSPLKLPTLFVPGQSPETPAGPCRNTHRAPKPAAWWVLTEHECWHGFLELMVK